MKTSTLVTLSVILVMLFATLAVFDDDVYARAGGGRSSGSSGSRSYSVPNRPVSTPPTPNQTTTAPSSQSAGGGFLRSMAGGLIGGMLGGMLFSSLGFGGTGAGIGGSGIGLFEIILLGAVGYFIYGIVKRRREAFATANPESAQSGRYTTDQLSSSRTDSQMPTGDAAIGDGIRYIQQMDPSFDDTKFKDEAMDIFFNIQSAWANRNLAMVTTHLTDEMKNILQQDISSLLREKKINRLENIAVRKVDIVEAWQEAGQDFIKILFTANLLDYTTDELTGSIVAGSKTEPVKFEECWTFTRPVGNNPWKLSAISQV